MKKTLIGLSVGLNVVVAGVVLWLVVAPFSLLGLFIGDFVGASHERWVSQFEELAVQSGEVVFLGDSITEGGSWHELFPRAQVRNRGIGGDVTEGVLARLHQVTSGAPGKVFLLIGTNDLFFGVSEDQIVANVDEIITRINAESPGTSIYIQSVLPRAEGLRARVESLNARLESLSRERGVAWVNLYPHFLDTDGSIRDDLANDELHLLGAGYLVWREQIEHLVAGGA